MDWCGQCHIVLHFHLLLEMSNTLEWSYSILEHYIFLSLHVGNMSSMALGSKGVQGESLRTVEVMHMHRCYQGPCLVLQHIEHYIAAAKGTFTLRIHTEIRNKSVQLVWNLLRICCGFWCGFYL